MLISLKTTNCKHLSSRYLHLTIVLGYPQCHANQDTPQRVRQMTFIVHGYIIIMHLQSASYTIDKTRYAGVNECIQIIYRNEDMIVDNQLHLALDYRQQDEVFIPGGSASFLFQGAEHCRAEWRTIFFCWNMGSECLFIVYLHSIICNNIYYSYE